jgi:putative molybdopterin biosynthesis protein
VAQGRADWGMTIEPVAKAYVLAFLPFAEEHYDLALVSARRDSPAVTAFLELLASPAIREALVSAGFRPA